MNNLTTRTITGVLFVICVIGSVILSHWAFAVLFLVVSIAGFLEFTRLMRISKIIVYRPSGILFGAVLYTSITLWEFGVIDANLLLVNFLILPLLLIVELFRKSTSPFLNSALGLLGMLWIILPLSLLNGFFNHSDGPKWLHSGALLGFFLILWIYDSGAYIFGSLFGRHPMLERISPKKSWEGFIGGSAAGLLTAYMVSASFIEFSVLQWILIGIVIIVFGTFGDLVESMLKRSSGVKDSGSILPGHGGILDRFDAVLLAAPAVFILIYLFR
ncbi:MAG: phosphatidate cytidylyltransferase [Bacteroidales bacterium]|nr:phosphatidate cytidylyltransferase [Bacteroidales bacterium]